MSSPETALALFGIMLIAVLQVLRVKASMLIGILGTLLLGIALHRVHWQPTPYSISAIKATAFHLDVRGALQHGALEIIFVFLFVDLFDNIGTLVAVAERAGLMSKDHTIPRLERIFFADASATVFGALSGTSTVTSYIESAAGVAEGGRTGVTAIVTGLLFLVAMFVAPLVGAIPTFATSPALIIVGGLMLAGVGTIEWHEPTIAIPAFLTLVTIPLTYSIADGLSFGLDKLCRSTDSDGSCTKKRLDALHPCNALRVAVRLRCQTLSTETPMPQAALVTEFLSAVRGHAARVPLRAMADPCAPSAVGSRAVLLLAAPSVTQSLTGRDGGTRASAGGADSSPCIALVPDRLQLY